MRSKQKQQLKKGNQKSLISAQLILNRKIVSPQKLKILVLAGNELLNEHLQFLQKCVNLIKLDLSHNMISKLTGKVSFQHMNKLQVLQLHYNKISNIQAIETIFECQIITYLTIHHNPIDNNVKNQHTIINSLPSLKLLNNRIIFVEELSNHMIHERPPTYLNSDLFENWKSTENSEAYYLKVLNLQLQFIDNMWTFNNPIIIIQRAWRHFISPEFNASQSLSSAPRTIRSKLTSRKDRTTSKLNNRRQLIESHPLQTFFQEWKSFSQSLKQVRQTLSKIKDEEGKIHDKTYFLEPLEDYQRILRNMKVGEPIGRQMLKIRQKIYRRKMAYVLLANLKIKYQLFQGPSSFYDNSGINQTHKIFYNRNQQHLLDNFLTYIAEKYDRREVIYNQSSIQVSKAYNSIRLVDPESYVNKYSESKRYFSFISFLWPSMRAVIMNRKKEASLFKSGFNGLKQLSYIRNRDKILTKEQIKKSTEVFNQLKKFSSNEYESSLCYFQCKDELVMRYLLRFIYYHNTKALKINRTVKKSEMLSLFQNYEEPFIIYVEKILKKTCAAVLIQKTWRRYSSNKHQKESIYFKMQKNRAALHIQYFFRNCVYKHRHHFSNKLNRDLSIIKSNTIIYPLQLYMNFKVLYNQQYKGRLYNNLKLIRNNDRVGLSQQYYRPIFSELIRKNYFQGQNIGLQSSQQTLDIYNLIHGCAEIKTIVHNHHNFISFTYSNRLQASKVAAVISLLSYQMYGKYYIFALTKENTQLWLQRSKEYKKVRLIANCLKDYRQDLKQTYISKQIKQTGVFLYLSDYKFAKSKEKLSLNVEFYQKRYHNFPAKYAQSVSYSFINCDHLFLENNTNFPQDSNPTEHLVDIKQQQQNRKSFDRHQFKQLMSKTNVENFKNVNPFTVTMIDSKKLSFFDKSQKVLAIVENPKFQLEQINRMSALETTNKKNKVHQFYKNQIIKRQVKKELKQTSLAAMRQKTKNEKVMNMTLKNMKEGQRTEQLRNKVNKIKEFKTRLSHKKEDESDFIQQNNFVMEQQLRMVIMRNKIKETEKRKQQNFQSRNNSLQRNSEIKTVQSRKSSKQKMKFQEDLPYANNFTVSNNINAVVNNGGTILLNSSTQGIVSGDEGSIVNIKRKSRKPRANSIGAYIRDPSYVHGVFPQEYYPIQNRSTTFYFPPVI